MTATSEITDCLSAALSYAANGWDVFPAPRGTKKSHKKAARSNGANWGKTKDPDEIRRDFARWPDANVGIPTGVDNGFFVVEADTVAGHNVDGIANLKALEARYGALPPTLMAQSPTGSIHYYFRHPGGSIKIKNSASEVATGIDVRGDGGMVIAPPSVKVGVGAYVWLNNLPIADAPSWLIELVVEPTVIHEPVGSPDVAADETELAAAIEVISNPDLGWEDWNRVGMALRRATDGSEGGRKLWHAFSGKSAKYNAHATDEKWHSYFASPPLRIGAGTIFWMADQAGQGWRIRYELKIERALRDAGLADIAEAAGQNFTFTSGIADTISSPRTNAEPPGNVGDGTSPRQNNAGPTSTRIVTPPSNGEPPGLKRKLLFSSAEFVAGFVPPDYLIDGMLLRKNVYALTGRTGDGKTAVAIRIAAHVARGLPLGGRSVEKGRVVYFAGENPDDVRARWVKQCEEMKLNPEELEVFFMSGAYPISTDEVRGLIEADVAATGPISLLIVDTSAAYYSGDDENDNVKLGAHARMLRSFVNLSGNPTVLTTCHPTKNPDMENLQPRGGGAFIAEIDGNLVAIKERGSMLVVIDTHGKFRGPEFEPFSFKLVEGTSEKLKDTKGRLIWTVFAMPVTEAERAAMETAGDAKRTTLLKAMKGRPASSIAELAAALGWTYKNGGPNRTLVYRLLKQLQGERLVEKKGQRYVITNKGKTAAEEDAAGSEEEPF